MIRHNFCRSITLTLSQLRYRLWHILHQQHVLQTNTMEKHTCILKIYYCGLISFGSGNTKCRQFAICKLQFCQVPALPPPYKAGWIVKETCLYNPDFQGVRISLATLESIHINQSIARRINNLHNKCILFQYVVLSNVKNMIVYTWNVVSTLYPACIMSCISFVNGITQVNRENHSKAFHSWLISLIPESPHITNICMGPLMLMVYGGMVTSKNGAIYFTTF